MSTEVDTDAFVAGLDYPMDIVTAASAEGGETSQSGCLVGFQFDLGDQAGFLLASSQVEAEPGTAPLHFSQVLDLDAGHSA